MIVIMVHNDSDNSTYCNDNDIPYSGCLVAGDCTLLAEKKYSLWIAGRLHRCLCGVYLKGSKGSIRVDKGVKVKRV